MQYLYKTLLSTVDRPAENLLSLVQAVWPRPLPRPLSLPLTQKSPAPPTHASSAHARLETSSHWSRLSGHAPCHAYLPRSPLPRPLMPPLPMPGWKPLPIGPGCGPPLPMPAGRKPPWNPIKKTNVLITIIAKTERPWLWLTPCPYLKFLFESIFFTISNQKYI